MTFESPLDDEDDEELHSEEEVAEELGLEPDFLDDEDDEEPTYPSDEIEIVTNDDHGGTLDGIEANGPHVQLVEAGLTSVTDIEVETPEGRIQLESICHSEPISSYNERMNPRPESLPGGMWVTPTPRIEMDADIEVPTDGEEEAEMLLDAYCADEVIDLVYTIEGGDEIVFEDWFITGIHHSHDYDYTNGLIQLEAEQIVDSREEEIPFRPDWILTNPGHPHTSGPYHHNGGF